MAENCQVITVRANAKLERCANMDVLFLNGTPLQRARANGSMLRDVLDQSTLQYFSHKLIDSSGHASYFAKKRNEWLVNQLTRLLQRNTPSAYTEEIDAMAEELRIDPIALRRAYSLPDIAALVNALGNLELFRSLPSSGCTSLVKKGSQFVVGRNLDFAGVGTWDKHPMITVSLPEPGSKELKHASIAAHGVHYAGITGVNQAGITFAVHQNYSNIIGINGMPMFFLGEAVLREAESIEQAIAILKKNRPGPLWTFVVTNLNTGEAVAVESSQSTFFVRRMEKAETEFVQTNHVMNKNTSMQFISIGTKANSLTRMKIALERLSQSYEGDDWVSSAAHILSYQDNPKGELSAYHDVLKAHTIQTVLFHAKGRERFVYVSKDEAPTAGGAYLKIPLQSLWNGSLTHTEAEAIDFVKTPETKRMRQKEISLAFKQYFDEHNAAAALQTLSQHDTMDAALFRAVVSFQQKKYEESTQQAEHALQNPRWLGEPAYIRQSFSWILLASAVQQNKNEEAKKIVAGLSRQTILHTKLKELMDAVASGQNPRSYLMPAGFEFFTGDLSGRAR